MQPTCIKYKKQIITCNKSVNRLFIFIFIWCVCLCLNIYDVVSWFLVLIEVFIYRSVRVNTQLSTTTPLSSLQSQMNWSVLYVANTFILFLPGHTKFCNHVCFSVCLSVCQFVLLRLKDIHVQWTHVLVYKFSIYKCTFRPATANDSVRITATSTSTSPAASTSSGSERRSSSATRNSNSASHRHHRDRTNSSSAHNRHSTSSLNPPRVSSAHSALTNNNVINSLHSNHSHSNSEDNSPSDGDLPRRRSTRRRNYLNRNQLHNALDLPQGYGRYCLLGLDNIELCFTTHQQLEISQKVLIASGHRFCT